MRSEDTATRLRPSGPLTFLFYSPCTYHPQHIFFKRRIRKIYYVKKNPVLYAKALTTNAVGGYDFFLKNHLTANAFRD
jgi:hypothetical protein